MKRLGARIRALRSEREITVSQLAQAVGLSDSQMYSIEGGRFAPSFGTFVAIAHALRVEEMDLFVSPGMSPRHDLVDLTRTAPPAVITAHRDELAKQLGIPEEAITRPRKA
jgi:DNA-binding XRE family transcriptional regulator